MTRAQDLADLRELSTRPCPVLRSIDMTPVALALGEYSEWFPVPANTCFFGVEQETGAGKPEVEIEASNTKRNPEILDQIATKLAGAGTGQILDNWKGAAFARAHYARETGETGNTVSVTMVWR